MKLKVITTHANHDFHLSFRNLVKRILRKKDARKRDNIRSI